MATQHAAFDGNPFVGLYVRASDDLALISPSAPDKFVERCKALETKIEMCTIGGASLLGLFSAMNKRGVLVPRLVYNDEKKKLKGFGLDVAVLESRFTAIGNNILLNDKAAVVNPNMPKEDVKKISEVFGVEVVAQPIGGYNTVGSIGVVTNKGLLLHANASEEELSELEGIFGVKGSVGTANMGVSFVGISLAANSKGAVVGELTSGFEMSRIDEALGFM